MGRLSAKFDYEEIRNARILQNRAKLTSLGASFPKSVKLSVRKPSRIDYSCMPLCRSSRLMKVSTTQSPSGHDSLRRSDRLRGISRGLTSLLQASQAQLSPEIVVRGCHSQSRGSVYSPIFGICCHFCRQKKLCGEEDCKRCENPDTNEPCTGKTDCWVCYSSNGVLCGACLKVKEVRANKNWMCPHCIDEKGIKPNWTCDSYMQSLFCRK